MELLNKIVEGRTIKFGGQEYKILGKAYYVTQNDTETTYAKILLEGHHVLVVVPSEEIAYFGKNEGKLSEFDTYPVNVEYKGKIYHREEPDYQIVTKIEFGSPLAVEGEVEFWDYEVEDLVISIAVTSREKVRADVVARYISIDDINIL